MSATASPVGFGFGFLCVWVWSFVLGAGAAAVSGKCYLTASVTLHNCSHFLDCATVAVAVAVAALRCLNLLLFCLSCRISGATDGVRSHYDYLERITRPRLEPKTETEVETEAEAETEIEIEIETQQEPKIKTNITITILRE